MNKYINELLQIQDMLFVLHENDILHKSKGIEESVSAKLKKNVAAMKEILPSEVESEYDRMVDRYEIFVVPMMNDTCMGCFMKLPVGVANNVKNFSNCINSELFHLALQPIGYSFSPFH